MLGPQSMVLSSGVHVFALYNIKLIALMLRELGILGYVVSASVLLLK